MATIFTFLAREEDVVYPTDYRGEIEAIIARWRPQVAGMTAPRTGQPPVSSVAEALDTIAAVLPIGRRDKLAELLTDQDVETLRHLVNAGMGGNTLRALTSDLGYLKAWALAATGEPLPWPAPEALLLKFVAQHLWDPQKRATDPDHGMPADVDDNLRAQGFLKSTGPHAPATVRRRLANWSTLTKWRGLDGAFTSPALKSAIRLSTPQEGRQQYSLAAPT